MKLHHHKICQDVVGVLSVTILTAHATLDTSPEGGFCKQTLAVQYRFPTINSFSLGITPRQGERESPSIA